MFRHIIFCTRDNGELGYRLELLHVKTHTCEIYEKFSFIEVIFLCKRIGYFKVFLYSYFIVMSWQNAIQFVSHHMAKCISVCNPPASGQLIDMSMCDTYHILCIIPVPALLLFIASIVNVVISLCLWRMSEILMVVQNLKQ